MPHSRAGFTLSIFVALLAISLPGLAAAQDMPSIFSGAPDLPAATAMPTPASAPQAAPSAQAAIPAAPMPAPVKKPQLAAAKHSPAPHRRVAATAEKRKFAALMKKLTPVHRAAEHRVVEHRETVTRIAEREPNLPPGTVIPPPGYYPPGPYARLVYGGPSRGPYGWGGYARPYSYYGNP